MAGHDAPNPIKLLSNALLLLGAAAGGLGLVRIGLASRDLPPGVCPITDNRPWLYLAIALLLASLVLSFFEKPRAKRK
jgi:hypothetical protein